MPCRDASLLQKGVCVDMFLSKSHIYFLTHFHTDHTQGLSDRTEGVLVCSVETWRCLVARWGIPPRLQHIPIEPEMGCVHLPQGISVVAIDAQHCPGSLMFCFPEERILYTGDFRMSQEFTVLPTVDTLYFDNEFTSVNSLPSKEDAITMLREFVKRSDHERIVVLTTHIEVVFGAFPNAHIHESIPDWCPGTSRRNEASSRVWVVHPRVVEEQVPEGSRVYISLLWFLCHGREEQFRRGWGVDTDGSYRILYGAHAPHQEVRELMKMVNPVRVEGCRNTYKIFDKKCV